MCHWAKQDKRNILFVYCQHNFIISLLQSSTNEHKK